MRRIAQLPGYVGVTMQGAVGVCIKDLWYADDMLAFANSVQQLRLLLSAIHEWSQDWGIKVGVGTGKTNVMFVPGSADSAAPAEPLHIGDSAVPWVTEYRYLGYHLRPDLCNDAYLPNIRRRMDRIVNVLLKYNRVVRTLSVALQLQMTHSLVLGCANYLLGVVPFTNTAQVEALDVPMRAAARIILGAPNCCSKLSLAADSRFLPMQAIIAQHRLRFEQYLRHTPSRHAPAVAVMQMLQHLERHGTGRISSWVQVTKNVKIDIQSKTGLQCLDAQSLVDAHRVAAVTARYYGYALLRQEAARTNAAQDCVAGAPDSTQPAIHDKSLHMTGWFDKPHARARTQRLAAVVGHSMFATPMSAWGPGCDGSVVALADRLGTSKSRLIQASRHGTWSMTMWPFAVAGEFRKRPGDDDSPIFVSPDSHPLVPISLADWTATAGRCRLCGHGSENVWHLLADCVHSHVVEHRERFYSSARGMLEKICAQISRASERAQGVISPGLETAIAAVRARMDDLRPTAADGRFVMYRLLLCAPFSSFDVRFPAVAVRRVHAADSPRVSNEDALPLAHALGSMLDAVVLPRRFLRPLANAWSNWSAREVKILVGLHACARRCFRPDFPCCCRAAAEGTASGSANHAVPSLHEFTDVNEEDAFEDE